MQIKNVSMMFAAACVIAMLTGCGIPEEEHYAILAEMDAKYTATEEGLNAQIAELDAKAKSEEAKARAANIELEDAAERIKGLQDKNKEVSESLAAAEQKIAGLESDLSSSKAATSAANDAIAALQAKYNQLTDAYAELERRFQIYVKNFGTIKPAEVPEGAEDLTVGAEEAKPEAGADADKVSNLLDAMGDM